VLIGGGTVRLEFDLLGCYSLVGFQGTLGLASCTCLLRASDITRGVTDTFSIGGAKDLAIEPEDFSL